MWFYRSTFNLTISDLLEDTAQRRLVASGKSPNSEGASEYFHGAPGVVQTLSQPQLPPIMRNPERRRNVWTLLSQKGQGQTLRGLSGPCLPALLSWRKEADVIPLLCDWAPAGRRRPTSRAETCDPTPELLLAL